jgi:Mce-associated membrane protein
MIRLKSRPTGERDEDEIVDDEIVDDKVVYDEVVDEADVSETSPDDYGADVDEKPASVWRRIRWSRWIAYGLLPVLVVLLASAAGFLKWQEASGRDAQAARTESMHAATDGTIALLSYRADTVEKDLEAARSRLTGSFLNAYTSLTHEVVIPGAKQKQISAVATVPAAASVSASANHAVVLLFVNQSLIIGQDAPTSTASSVRVTLDKVRGHWLISGFDPV